MQRANPPIEKNYPKIGGAIAWSRSLFFRIKATIIKFKSFPDMLANEQGRIIIKKYMTVARAMREHDEQLFFGWCSMVETKASLYLKEFVLEKVPTIPTIVVDGEKTDEHDTTDFVRLSVNFRSNLKDMIKETKFLEKMDFGLPETAINIALQVNYNLSV